jgi:hypothetical protein
MGNIISKGLPKRQKVPGHRITLDSRIPELWNFQGSRGHELVLQGFKDSADLRIELIAHNSLNP